MIASVFDGLKEWSRFNSKLRRYINKLAGREEHDRTPVFVIDADSAPIFRDAEPNSPNYWRDQPCIEVGIEWMIEKFFSCEFTKNEE